MVQIYKEHFWAFLSAAIDSELLLVAQQKSRQLNAGGLFAREYETKKKNYRFMWWEAFYRRSRPQIPG